MHNLSINKDVIDDRLKWIDMPAEEFCKIVKFDYADFKKIYNKDLSISLQTLIQFAKCFNISMRDLIVIWS